MVDRLIFGLTFALALELFCFYFLTYRFHDNGFSWKIIHSDRTLEAVNGFDEHLITVSVVLKNTVSRKLLCCYIFIILCLLLFWEAIDKIECDKQLLLSWNIYKSGMYKR